MSNCSMFQKESDGDIEDWLRMAMLAEEKVRCIYYTDMYWKDSRISYSQSRLKDILININV